MGILERLRDEVRVIRSAPFSFLVFIGVGFTSGYLASNWYYSKQLIDTTGQVARYRVALGIDPASPGALVELDNEELGLKTELIVGKLRELALEFRKKNDEIGKRKAAGEIDEKEMAKEIQQSMHDTSEAFDSNLASDAYNVEHELTKRLSPEAIANVPRVPALLGDGQQQNRLDIMAIMRGTGSDVLFFSDLADELDRMAKLLPTNSTKP